ncbi:CIMIP2 protein GA14893 [Musca vetustissima]|uniref:CIMIP2 protein GA14893 n=1 Tax=Musca vetustissima TaxID=27455 RepID=UPI002AB76F67|nr:CIMIP2 protein GA14893 [Musca vetustissima]
MDSVITPEPHYMPGYTGHCPQYRFRQGKTFAKLSHQLLLDPCAKHAPELILSTQTKPKEVTQEPSANEIEVLKNRSTFLDSIYKPPIIPGYEGFIPNLQNKTGQRYLIAATKAIAEHEHLAERLRCERRSLEHCDLLESGNGLFEAKLRERMMPITKYRAPLVPVLQKGQAVNMADCKDLKIDKLQYSKFTVPHFMEDGDEEKYIINGYAGHIPMTMTHYGQSNKRLTNSALCEFTNNYHHRQSAEWCPMELTGIANACPNAGQFVIYHRTIGMIPKYAGHVPGEAYAVGRTYGNATVNAKSWLELHKD